RVGLVVDDVQVKRLAVDLAGAVGRVLEAVTEALDELRAVSGEQPGARVDDADVVRARLRPVRLGRDGRGPGEQREERSSEQDLGEAIAHRTHPPWGWICEPETRFRCKFSRIGHAVSRRSA